MYEFLTQLFGEVDGQPEALTAEQLVAKIEADKKLKLVNLADGGYVAKEKFDSKETELAGVRQQLADANTQIQSYQGMDIDAIKQSAKNWETKYNDETKKLTDQLAAQERAHQTDMFLSDYQFTSKAARAGVRAEFDKKGFKLENGTFLGAQDYMKGLMEDEDYKGAFVQETKQEPEDKPDDTKNTEPEPQKPTFAAATNGGQQIAPDGNGPAFNFGFQRIREPKKE